jgi:hypothetical protein
MGESYGARMLLNVALTVNHRESSGWLLRSPTAASGSTCGIRWMESEGSGLAASLAAHVSATPRTMQTLAPAWSPAT